MRVTAVICTYNRATYLPVALESLLQQRLSPTDYEILIVDNGSTDETPAVLRSYLAAPGAVTLRSIVAPALGLSRARNLAVQQATGEIIAFLDDDAAAAPQWLEKLLDVYAVYPDAWAVGGKVSPRWASERPHWLTDDLLMQLSMLDLGDAVRPLAPDEELYGANCSFRRQIFTELGLFRVDLGRTGKELLGSEESEFQQRIRRRGQGLMYTPHAEVHHWVMAERLQPRYFIQLAYGKGRTLARLMLTNTPRAGVQLWRITRGWLTVVRQWLQLSLHPYDQRGRLQCLRVTAHWRGFTMEVLAQGFGRHAGRD